MTTPLDYPVVSPVLIGRVAPLAALDQAIAHVQAGQGRTILITGEAGIGKSRLVAETKARFLAYPPAGEAAGPILAAQCFEPDQTLPYAPLLELLRSLLGARRPTDLAYDLGAIVGGLGRLLPELAALLPAASTLPPAAPEQEKQSIFQALARLLLGRAAAPATSPLLLIIEDLHWCDETSLDFLVYLARRLAAHPVLLLLTYRSDEVHAPLRHFLATLERQRLMTELSLPPLTPGEVDALIRAIFAQPQPVRGEFLDTLYALTEGNPFFLEEALKALLAAGEIFYTESAWTRKPLGDLHIPRTIQDAVQRRTQRLSAPAHALLAQAAVVGRGWDFALLQELTGHTEGDLLALIKELIAAQLVVEESADRFAFRHALTRQAVRAELLARERRSLHYRIAETMERVYADTLDAHLANLAYHYAEAGT
jgi:predicted ATPase